VAERERERVLLTGDVPSPINQPSGCVFRTRCPLAIEECAQELPPPVELGPNHVSFCLRAGESILEGAKAAR
jgi:oligopeptide/dipeptide ABC transporter ATP-binding protein